MHYRFRKLRRPSLAVAIPTGIAVVCAVIFTSIGIVAHPSTPVRQPAVSAPAASASNANQSTTSPTLTVCVAPSFPIQAGLPAGDHGNWDPQGVASIAVAKNSEQARAALDSWVKANQSYTYLLIGMDWYVRQTVVSLNSPLVENGCATPYAVSELAAIKQTIAQSQVLVALAPSDGYNSGTDTQNGSVQSNTNPGVTGPRQSVQVNLPSDNTIYVMSICGNVVTPPGHTPTPTPCPCSSPTPTPCPVCTTPVQVSIPPGDQNPTSAPTPTPTPSPSPSSTPTSSPTPNPSPTPNGGNSGGGSGPPITNPFG